MHCCYDALGAAHSNQALPVLRAHLERPGLFTGKKSDEMRGGAARALALIGTPEALAILHAGDSSRNTAIRDACQRAQQAVRAQTAASDGQEKVGRHDG